MGSLSIFKEEHQQPNSSLDCLPDDVILIIFNKIQDGKTLVASFSLNKRLAPLIHETDVISLALIAPYSSTSYLSSLSYSLEKQDASYNEETERKKNKNNWISGNFVKMFKSAVNYLTTKLPRRSGDYRRVDNGDGHGDPVSDSLCRCLRTFRRMSHLHIKIRSDLPDVVEVPHWALGDDDDIMRWKASYGSDLKTWTLICCSATLHPFAAGEWWPESDPREKLMSRSSRITSCLKVAHARHRLVKEMVAQFPALKTVTVTDAKSEGRLSMSENDIRDLGESEEGAPARLLLRMWYTPLLELPVAKCTWNDAMLIVIRPLDSHGREMVPPAEEENGGGNGEFDGDPKEKAMFAEAQREIVISSKTVHLSWTMRTTRIERDGAMPFGQPLFPLF